MSSLRERGTREERADLVSPSSDPGSPDAADDGEPLAPKSSAKKKLILAVALTSLLAVIAFITMGVVLAAQTKSDNREAVCYFNPSDPVNAGQTKIEGKISIRVSGEGSIIKYEIKKGLPATDHAVAIKQYGLGGDMTTESDTNALTGPVYNPSDAPFGCRDSNQYRSGDLGNIKGLPGGNYEHEQTERMVMLGGPWSVAGRALLVYELADDCHAKKSALDNANFKVIGGCNIVVMKPH